MLAGLPAVVTSSSAAGDFMPWVDVPAAGTSDQLLLPDSQVRNTLNHIGPAVSGNLPRSMNSSKCAGGKAASFVVAVQVTLVLPC